MTNEELYWKTNVKYLLVLIPCWFVVALVLPIMLADWLNQFHFGGFPLGFWFAMQGSLIGFVILIFIYVRLMNKLDKKHHLDK
jgi:putative solute:sodium symporter small subunit